MPYIQLQFRRDTSTNWTSANPVLASGEMGIELDTRRFKIGDGCLSWNNLPYGGLQGPTGPAGGGGSGGTSATGSTGATGVGVPSGGTSGQVLAKTSSSNYATGWVNPPASGVSSIVAGTNVTISPFNGLGAVTINASGGGSSLTTYIIKVQTAPSGPVAFGNGWSILAAQSSTGTVLVNDVTGADTTKWSITAPATPSVPGGIAGSTYLSIVYPVSFTGSFTNFRRAIPGSTAGSWLFSALTATGVTGNIAVVSPGSRTLIIGPVTLAATGWAANQINYFIFDYLQTSLLI